jgi:AbrB family looped-hinge helix DNA binding protein
MVSTLKVSVRGTMVLPKRVREKFGLKRGGRLVMEETPLGVLLRSGTKSGPVESYTPARLAEFSKGERELEAFLKSRTR